MGLKDILKKQQSSTKQENNSEAMNLQALILEQSEKIQKLSSTNSELQTSNQILQSELTTATERIESLTNRAASVNSTELENKKLWREAQEAKALSDEALRKAERARQQTKAAHDSAEIALRERQEEALAKNKAIADSTSAKTTAQAIKMTYSGLFIGQMILTLALAFFVAYGRRSVLLKMAEWFPARWENFTGLLAWLISLFMASAHYLQRNTGGVWGYVVVTIEFLGAGVLLFYLCCWLKDKILGFWWNLKSQYKDGTFKTVISADIALVMLYVCLFFHDSE